MSIKAPKLAHLKYNRAEIPIETGPRWALGYGGNKNGELGSYTLIGSRKEQVHRLRSSWWFL